MKRLNPDKLFVEFRDGVTPTNPIISRKYTLTHSDVTAELFLTIGLSYAYDKISPMRDEVLAEWTLSDNQYILKATVQVDNNGGFINSAVRNRIFIRELPLALEAIVYGDKELFKAHPVLTQAPIYIHFESVYPYFDRKEYWGTPADYQ
ncbi:staygreen family protein [Orenia marismortui]|uniref:staygreen family protein n=1 Tax=Orenia marismortui TaxID=46469 RepID=UPI0004767A78|nr:staygreen family protein [Orenia marismortui]